MKGILLEVSSVLLDLGMSAIPDAETINLIEIATVLEDASTVRKATPNPSCPRLSDL